MSHQRNSELDNAIDAANRVIANSAVAVERIERALRHSPVPPDETAPPDAPCMFRGSRFCPECDAECTEARRLAEGEPDDDSPNTTGGIPVEVYRDIIRGRYSDPYQAAIATAAAMRTDYEAVKYSLTESRRALAATEHIAKVLREQLEIARAELQATKPAAPVPSSKMMPKEPGLYWVYDRTALIKADIFKPWNALLLITGDRSDMAVTLHRIFTDRLSITNCWSTNDLTFGPRIDPPKLVLEQSESETS